MTRFVTLITTGGSVDKAYASGAEAYFLVVIPQQLFNKCYTTHMREMTKRVLIMLIAVTFLLVGLAGLILPIIPGIVCLAISIILLTLVSPSIRTFVHRHTVKYPKLHQHIVVLESRLTMWFGDF